MRCTRAGIESLVNPEGENAVLEILSIENLLGHIVDNAKISENGSVNDENNHDDDHALLPSLKEQLRVLALLVQVLKCRAVSSADMSRILLSCRRTLRSVQAASMSQRAIRIFFR